MLHIITENNELKNRTFPLPDGVRKILTKTLSNYNGDKTVDGYKRLNNILEMNTISFQEMKRLKNFFDNYRGTDKSTEYILNGGDAMKTWVNNTLYTATKAVHDFKQAKKDAGIDNAFIKHHTKDRQNKRKNKPTQAKFDTKDISNKMMTNNSLKYESIFIQGGTKSLSAISNGGIAKDKKVVVITESQKRKLLEAMDDTFDFAELSNIRSFNGRVKYCKKHLGQPIGRGSSRITFQIDDENVLKLAWNEKGVGQNIEEERAYGDDIFPTVSKSDDNGLWLVSEFVLPAKAQDFKYCFGMTFREFCNFIGSCGKYRFGMRTWQQMPEEQWIEYLENNEQLAAFDDYIGNYGKYVVGDMMRMCNYGLTNRNGEPTIVLLDSGLTEDIYNTFYKRR